MRKSTRTLGLALCVFFVSAVSLIAAALIDINTASKKDLEALKGVGSATAAKIIAHRPYKTVDDLARAGLSAKLIASLRSQLTVSDAAPSAAATKIAKPSTTAAATPAGPIDLNTASAKELEALRGVGPATANKIIAARPYHSVDELSKAGVNAKLIAELKPFVTVGAVATAKSTQPVAAGMATPSAPAPAPAVQPAPVPAAVPTTPASRHTAAKLAPGQVVNINTASKEELDALLGIGPVKAQAIIEGRPYERIEDIMKVKGIKQGEFGKIKDLITVK